VSVVEASLQRESVITEPILAWRAWTLHVGRGQSGPLLRPIGDSRRTWPAREPASASCPRRTHDAPGFSCTCGLHATRTPDLLRRARDPAVVGSVALWGRIVEHVHGYRAALAYPQRLRLICYLCFWQWGIDEAAADLVTCLRRGRLVPLCLDHVELSNRYGYPTPSLVPASEVEGALLSNYAVDVLRTNIAAVA
jgi:hypothetical protein